MGREMDGRVVFSVGHSHHELGAFTTLLKPFGIDTVVDVRTYPASRFAPDFSRGNLERRLPDQGFRYVFLGFNVGGRPSNPAYYDSEGHVLYEKTREDEELRSEHLLQSAGWRRQVPCLADSHVLRFKRRETN